MWENYEYYELQDEEEGEDPDAYEEDEDRTCYY